MNLEMNVEQTREVVVRDGREGPSCPPTCRLARDWLKMADGVDEDHGVRVARLEVPRIVVETIVETTQKFIRACEAQEHFGYGYDDAIKGHRERSDELSSRHRLALARDWLRLHPIATSEKTAP